MEGEERGEKRRNVRSCINASKRQLRNINCGMSNSNFRIKLPYKVLKFASRARPGDVIK